MADYYDILGVSRSADDKEIRQAYRRLARQHHPDVNPGDAAAAERFKTINAAYEVLSDADKRTKYDRYGDRWEQAEHFEQQRGAGPSQFFRGGNFGGGSGGFNFRAGGATLSDLLGGMGGFASEMGGNVSDRLRPRPADVKVEITLEEADRGHDAPGEPTRRASAGSQDTRRDRRRRTGAHRGRQQRRRGVQPAGDGAAPRSFRAQGRRPAHQG